MTTLPTNKSVGDPGMTSHINAIATEVNDKVNKGDLPGNVKDYAQTSAQRTVVGNGVAKPLSGYYGTLGAAQAHYPAATALADELDWAVLQRACTASKTVRVPAGRYKLNRTLTLQANQILEGDSPESTIFERTANYGDTVTIGTVPLNAGNFRVSGIYFYKPLPYTAGTTTTIAYPVAAGAAHLSVIAAAHAEVSNCWFSSMPYGIKMERSTVTAIRGCRFYGIWDNTIAGLQEAIASVWLKSDPADATNYNVLIHVDNCYFTGGYFSVSRNVTYGANVIAKVEQIGPKYGLLVNACEGLTVDGGSYFGGQAAWGIFFDKEQITAAIKIVGNFFDTGSEGSIYTETSTSDAIVGLVVGDNNFNGQLVGRNAIKFHNPGSIVSVVAAHINDNVIENYMETPLILPGVKGCTIADNSISAYNQAANVAGYGAAYTAGAYVYGSSSKVYSHGNSFGGAVNNLSDTNNCQWGVYYTDATFGFSRDDIEVKFGLASGGITNLGQPVTWIHAAEFGAVLGAPALTTNAGSTQSWWAFDAAADERVVGVLRVPPEWNTYNLDFYWTNVGAGAGDVQWHAATSFAADTATLTANTVLNSVTATAPLVDVLKVTRIATAVAVPAVGSLPSLVITRKATNGADTLANDAALIAVRASRAS